MLHMIVEQTAEYPMRMKYIPETNEFVPTDRKSLSAERGFSRPYGWIKESGTPPLPHWDCILMTENIYALGEEVEIKVIGVFQRSDRDHKYIAVESSKDISDISELSELEMEELHRLYPRVGEGEGWFGKDRAILCMETHEKSL